MNKRGKLFDKLTIVFAILFDLSLFGMLGFFIYGNSLVGWLLALSSIIMFLVTCWCLDNSTPLTESEKRRLEKTTLDEFFGY